MRTCGFYTRVGIRPNEGTIDVGLAVWLPGRRHRPHRPPTRADRDDRHRARSRPREVRDARADGTLAAHRQRQVLEGRASRWTSRSGRARRRSARTARTAKRAILRAPRRGSRSERVTSSRAGCWTGWIEAGGQRKELGPNARGNRDKSWGPRRWGGPKMWRWFSINIDDDTHFGGIVIGTEGGDLHRGWVWRDGGHESIAEWKVTSELEDDGVTHRATHVLATDKAGRTHALDAEVLRVEPGSKGVKPDTHDRERGAGPVDLRRPHRHGHQRVPPPARR